MTTKDIGDVGHKALEVLDTFLAEGKQATDVISIQKDGDQWVVLAEALERRAVPDTQDIIGKYEIRFDEAREPLNFKRIELRRRADLGVEEEAT